MTPTQVKNYYVTPTDFERETGYTRMTLWNWIKKKRIPPFAQKYLELCSDGLLKADKVKRNG